MKFNVAIQNPAVVAWDGAAARPIDVRGYVDWAFTFEVTAAIAADAVFDVQAAPPSAGNNCVPGTFADVPEVLTCVADWGAVPPTKTTVTIPAGTPIGSKCTGTLPCRSGAFIQLAPVSGTTASVLGTMTLHGPNGQQQNPVPFTYEGYPTLHGSNGQQKQQNPAP